MGEQQAVPAAGTHAGKFKKAISSSDCVAPRHLDAQAMRRAAEEAAARLEAEAAMTAAAAAAEAASAAERGDGRLGGGAVSLSLS